MSAAVRPSVRTTVAGEDLRREPVDLKLSPGQLGAKVTYCAAGIGKGMSRVTVPIFVLMRAMSFDPKEPDLKALSCVLRACHAIPCNFTMHSSEEGYNYDKLMISFRSAACRQRPTPLRNAKLFQVLATKRMAGNPDLAKVYVFEDVLADVINTYHNHQGVKGNPTYQVKDDELQATQNIALHVAPDALDLAVEHLHDYKWNDSGSHGQDRPFLS